MVAAGFLQNPNVIRWLGGVEPAWSLLTFESLDALRQEPSSENHALSLAHDLNDFEISLSAVTRNMLLFLKSASLGDGLKLTATGNLSRAVVAEMIDLFEWPDFNRADAYRYHKVLNEPDFLPLFFVRHGTWPQFDAGVLFWSLSVSASTWQTPKKLTRLCAIPNVGVLESTWDTGSLLVEARILRPLLWFGLSEYQSEEIPGRLGQRHFYRKSPLFDRFFAFDVDVRTTRRLGAALIAPS